MKQYNSNDIIMNNVAQMIAKSISSDQSTIPKLQYTLIKTIMIVLGVGVLWLSAKVSVPFYPVPFTMQTAAMLFIGISYGPLAGMLTVLSYLGLGALGLPVFAGTPEKGIGLAYMIGPTGGYLVGFVCATFVIGYLAGKGFVATLPKLIFTLFIGTAINYFFGLVWLIYLFGFSTNILMSGAGLFIVGDLAKIALVVFVFSSSSRFINKINK